MDSPEARQRLSHAHGDLDDANRVVGYDALTLGGVRKQALPIHYGRGLPGYDIGMVLLARFAIADGHQRQGLGRDLLIEAIERAPHRRHSRPAHPPVPDHRDQGRELAAAGRQIQDCPGHGPEGSNRLERDCHHACGRGANLQVASDHRATVFDRYALLNWTGVHTPAPTPQRPRHTRHTHQHVQPQRIRDPLCHHLYQARSPRVAPTARGKPPAGTNRTPPGFRGHRQACRPVP